MSRRWRSLPLACSKSSKLGSGNPFSEPRNPGAPAAYLVRTRRRREPGPTPSAASRSAGMQAAPYTGASSAPGLVLPLSVRHQGAATAKPAPAAAAPSRVS